MFSMSIFNKVEEKNLTTRKEYEEVRRNPIANGIVNSVALIIEILIMCVVLWNVFNYFTPTASWFNIVNGQSMEPTLYHGQILFSDAPATIENGDIVTAYMPKAAAETYSGGKKTVIIKRVIGIPGDNILIDETGVYVNGHLIAEPYLTDQGKAGTYEEGPYNSLTLGNGEYFVMGDNRTISYDSRSFGVIKYEDMLYKQSLKPTANFWLKATFYILVIIMCVFLCMLVNYVVTECAYAILLKKKRKQPQVSNQVATTTETIILKGEEHNDKRD